MSDKLLTQEEVNEIIKDRLAREKRKQAEQVAQLKARIAELEGETQESETETEQGEAEEPKADEEEPNEQEETTEKEAEEPKQGEELEEPETEANEVEQAEYKAKYFDAIKQVKLLDAGIPFDELERYAPYITGENEEEIERQALELAEEVESKRTRTYADPSSRRRVGVYNPFD